MNYNTAQIVLSPSTAESPRCNEELEMTFFHELIHAVLSAIGKEKWCNNENAVDLISSAIHQALKTATYPGGKRAK